MHQPITALPGALGLLQSPAARQIEQQAFGPRQRGFSMAEGFIAPSLINGWANFGGIYNQVGFYKDSDGRVHLRGLLAGGPLGSPAFVLPANYRPAATELIATAANAAFALVSIDVAGNVTPAVGSAIWFGLDNVSFRAA